MENNIRDYFIYGTMVSYHWCMEHIITNDNIDNILSKNDIDITDIIDCRDGNFFIVGKIIKKTYDSNPIIVPDLDEDTKHQIEKNVRDSLYLNTTFYHLYFVKNGKLLQNKIKNQ